MKAGGEASACAVRGPVPPFNRSGRRHVQSGFSDASHCKRDARRRQRPRTRDRQRASHDVASGHCPTFNESALISSSALVGVLAPAGLPPTIAAVSAMSSRRSWPTANLQATGAARVTPSRASPEQFARCSQQTRAVGRYVHSAGSRPVTRRSRLRLRPRPTRASVGFSGALRFGGRLAGPSSEAARCHGCAAAWPRCRACAARGHRDISQWRVSGPSLWTRPAALLWLHAARLHASFGVGFQPPPTVSRRRCFDLGSPPDDFVGTVANPETVSSWCGTNIHRAGACASAREKLGTRNSTVQPDSDRASRRQVLDQCPARAVATAPGFRPRIVRKPPLFQRREVRVGLPIARMRITGEDYVRQTSSRVGPAGAGPDWIVVSAHIDGHPHGESASTTQRAWPSRSDLRVVCGRYGIASAGLAAFAVQRRRVGACRFTALACGLGRRAMPRMSFNINLDSVGARRG